MRRIAFFLAFVCLSACTQSGAALHHAITGTANVAGSTVEQPGVSFSPPPGRTWTFLLRSTYQALLGAQGSSVNETYVTAETVYPLPSAMSPEQFFAYVRAERASEPQTGRFETVSNTEVVYTDRSEVCVKHRATSKDYGARRGGEFTLVDYLGMNCIHPSAEKVGVFVEYSRKAPTAADASFDADGMRVLRSVAFSPFK